MQQTATPTLFSVDPFVLISLGLLRTNSLVETTSFDQRPFLTPSQFGLCYFQACPEALAPKKPDPKVIEEPAKKPISKVYKRYKGLKRTMNLRSMDKKVDSGSQEFDIIQKKIKSNETISSTSTHDEEGYDAGRNQYNHSFKTIHITPLQTESLTLCMNSHFLKHKMTEELSSVVQSKYKLEPKNQILTKEKKEEEAIPKDRNKLEPTKEEDVVIMQNKLLHLGTNSFLHCHEELF